MDPKTEIITALHAEGNREIERLSRLLGLVSAIDQDNAAKAIDTFGGAEGAAAWLLSETIPGSPIGLAVSATGKRRVLSVLNAIDHGIFL